MASLALACLREQRASIAEGYGFEQRGDRELASGVNPVLEAAVFFEGGTFALSSFDAAEPWRIELRLAGMGRGHTLRSVPAPAQAAVLAGNVVLLQRTATLLEWYVNGPAGVEQGFVLRAPPKLRPASQLPEDRALVMAIDLSGPTEARVPSDGSSIHLQMRGRAPCCFRYGQLAAFDVTGRSLPAWLELDGASIRLRVDDQGASYPLWIDPLIWVEEHKLVTTSGEVTQRFGWSVAIAGDSALVGAPGDFDNLSCLLPGSVYLFERGGAGWPDEADVVLSAVDGHARNAFGNAIALQGDTLLVAARQDDAAGTYAGAVYVFEHDGSSWTQQDKLTASDTAMGDYFGTAVSMSGNLALIGAPFHEAVALGPGSAYVFERVGVGYTQVAELTAGDGQPLDGFGRSVAIDGDTALVGAPFDDTTLPGSGSAYVFVRSAVSWSPQQKLEATEERMEAEFGTAVALSGDTAVIGAPRDSDPAGHELGAVYVFVRSSGVWSLQQELLPTGSPLDPWFGWSVALWGDELLVAELRGGLFTAGAVSMFTRNAGVWGQTQAPFAASSADPQGNFGFSLARSEDELLVGARPDLASFPGAAYVFVLRKDNGDPCTSGVDCASGLCVDDVCCNEECGDGAAHDCQACSVVAGAPIDGQCEQLTGTPCDDGVFCNGVDTCADGTCSEHEGEACSGPDGDADCAESCDEQANACTAFDPNGATCADGSCEDGRCVKPDGAECTSEAECHSWFCVNNICCAVADCGAYRCGPRGACLVGCHATTDCAAGYQCSSDGVCVPAVGSAPPDAGSCGCAQPGRSWSARGALLVALGCLLLLRVRSSGPRRARRRGGRVC